jgi:hypothetical protein
MDKLPEKIAWVKNEKGTLPSAESNGMEYYDSFFNIWRDLDYTPDLRSLAYKAQDIVYDTLTDYQPLYKHYEHPLSYEMSDNAKRFYWIATDIYIYVVWLQAKDRFPDRTRLYCKKIYRTWIGREVVIWE